MALLWFLTLLRCPYACGFSPLGIPMLWLPLLIQLVLLTLVTCEKAPKQYSTECHSQSYNTYRISLNDGWNKKHWTKNKRCGKNNNTYYYPEGKIGFDPWREIIGFRLILPHILGTTCALFLSFRFELKPFVSNNKCDESWSATWIQIFISWVSCCSSWRWPIEKCQIESWCLK